MEEKNPSPPEKTALKTKITASFSRKIPLRLFAVVVLALILYPRALNLPRKKPSLLSRAASLVTASASWVSSTGLWTRDTMTYAGEDPAREFTRTDPPGASWWCRRQAQSLEVGLRLGPLSLRYGLWKERLSPTEERLTLVNTSRELYDVKVSVPTTGLEVEAEYLNLELQPLRGWKVSPYGAVIYPLRVRARTLDYSSRPLYELVSPRNQKMQKILVQEYSHMSIPARMKLGWEVGLGFKIWKRARARVYLRGMPLSWDLFYLSFSHEPYMAGASIGLY